MESIELVDLVSERLGGLVLFANDDFFASKDNLLKENDPVFIEDKYTSRGKWMDGWESRRRRTPGHDWCLIRLGLPGVIKQVVVDTSYFRGNYPDHCSIDACALSSLATVDQLAGDETIWNEILSISALKGDYKNEFEIQGHSRFTHLRFNIHPDGGVARLRVYGIVEPEKSSLSQQRVDLASVENGGRIIDCSDKFFGHPLNLIMPGRAANMSEGWETRRRRGPGNDWVIIRLAGPSEIQDIEIDTSHFKGNYPDTCSVETCNVSDANADPHSAEWTELLSQTKLHAHTRHLFQKELNSNGPVTHVRLNIYPDGGVSRLRVFGKLLGAKDGG
jgi:allantoicase